MCNDRTCEFPSSRKIHQTRHYKRETKRDNMTGRLDNMGLNGRKPDKVRLKPVCSATESN